MILYHARAAEELKKEMENGVRFCGWIEGDILLGIVGIQSAEDTALIRHSYMLTKYQRRGNGGKLLEHMMRLTKTPEILVGTWERAIWAIRFYEKYGFKSVLRKQKIYFENIGKFLTNK